MSQKAINTRFSILQQAFELVYRNGFQATSIDDIIATTKVTKGAFFYHFKNKEEMGLAMINEVMYPGMYEVLIRPLTDADEPAKEIQAMMRELLLVSPFFDVKYGCPAVNLIEEMSPLNEAFSNALLRLVLQWQKAMERCIERGKANGQVRADVDPEQVSCFLLAGYNGIRNVGKILGKSAYHTYLQELEIYLQRLN